MVLSTIGTLVAAAAIAGAAERKSKNAYPNLDKEAYDKHNALHGVNIYDINKIAARNGVMLNKDGILPEKGWIRCLDYVKQYANTLQEIEDFPKVWIETVQQQLNIKSQKIKEEAIQDYKRTKWQWDEIVEAKTKEREILQLKHWYGIGLKEHQKRVNKIADTDWSKMVATGPILRPVPGYNGTAHLEVWEMYKSPEIYPNPYTFYYKWFCKQCGYEPQL